MTILRNERTPRSEFIFYTDRLATLIVEHALNFLPHAPKEIRTPTGVHHVGMGNCEEVSWSKPCELTLVHYRDHDPALGRAVLARPAARHPRRAAGQHADPVRPEDGRAAAALDELA